MTTEASTSLDSVVVPSEAGLAAILERLRIALVTLRADGGGRENCERLIAARLEAARVVRAVPRRQLTNAVAGQVLALVRELRESGMHDELPADGLVGEFGGSNLKVPGVLAAMLMLASWRVPGAPLLADLPDWMWEDYAEWLFAAPARPLSPAEADACAAHWLRQASELARWVDRNLGSASVRRAAEAFVQHVSLLPLAPMNASLRPLAQVRAKILTRLHAHPAGEAPAMEPRAGRALRVGVLLRQLAATGETYAALARFEHLDRSQFDVTVLALRDDDAALASHVRARVPSCRVLPADPDGQVALLREGAFDVLLFAGGLNGAVDDFTRLALHRLAPLQVRLGGADGLTCGLPEIDLVLDSAAPAAVERFSERCGVVRGPMPVFGLQSVENEAEAGFERAALGIPAEATVLVTVLGPAQLDLTQVTTWARILAGAPEAHLLVFVGPGTGLTPGAAARLQTDLELAFAAAGVATSRLSVLASAASTHHEGRGVLRLADLFLAPLAGGEPIWVAEALTRGVPAVAAGSVGPGRRMLEAAAVADLSAGQEDDFVRQAVRLAVDPAERQAAAGRIAAAVEQGVDFLDTLAASDVCGDLLQAAYDELETTGRASFRAERTPLTGASAGTVEELLAAAAAAQAGGDWGAVRRWTEEARRQAPRLPAVRWQHGRALAADGAPERATTYLLAAIQQQPEEAELWYDLAAAFRGCGRNREAIQALEASLRLDRSRSDGWLLLIDLAEEGGAPDIAREAFEALRLVAPDHPRIAPLAERLAS